MERGRWDRQPGDTHQVPATVRMIFDPTSTVGAIAAGQRSPHPAQHRVPALVLDERPRHGRQKGTRPFAAIGVDHGQGRPHIDEARRNAVRSVSPERPGVPWPVRLLQRLIGVGARPGAVWHPGLDAGVETEVVRLGIEAGVPVCVVGSRRPPGPAQVHHHDVRAVFDVLVIPRRPQAARRQKNKGRQREDPMASGVHCFVSMIWFILASDH